jgi:hypothetical protein
MAFLPRRCGVVGLLPSKIIVVALIVAAWTPIVILIFYNNFWIIF